MDTFRLKLNNPVFQHGQQLCSGIPVPDGHMLIHRMGNNFGQMALRGFTDKP